MKFTVPAEKTLLHTMTLPMRWGDMDAFGHINNTLYFRYIEIARIEWMRALGVGMQPAGQGAVVVNAFCNFLRQLAYPGDLVAKLYAGEPGRSSIDTWVTLARSDEPDVLSAEGGATVVWFDFEHQRSAPWPAWMREQLSSGAGPQRPLAP